MYFIKKKKKSKEQTDVLSCPSCITALPLILMPRISSFRMSLETARSASLTSASISCSVTFYVPSMSDVFVVFFCCPLPWFDNILAVLFYPYDTFRTKFTMAVTNYTKGLTPQAKSYYRPFCSITLIYAACSIFSKGCNTAAFIFIFFCIGIHNTFHGCKWLMIQ